VEAKAPSKTLQAGFKPEARVLEAEQAANVWAEMANAEAGKRFSTGEEMYGYSSSFPDWVPEYQKVPKKKKRLENLLEQPKIKEAAQPGNLRSRKLFDEVQQHLIDGTVPTGTKQRELYEIAYNEILERLGEAPIEMGYRTERQLSKTEMKKINSILNKNSKNLTKANIDNIKNAISAKVGTLKKAPPLTKVEQATIDEINTALGRELFSRDIPQTALVMEARMAGQEAAHKFFQDIKQLGKKAQDAPEGYVFTKSPELAGLKFQPEVAKHIDSYYQKITNSEEINKFLKGWDKLQNLWKFSATQINPAFHSRNFVSNIWQNYLADINPFTPQGFNDYKDALMAMMGKPIKINGRDVDVLELFKKEGLGGTGWIGTDIEEAIGKEFGRRTNKLRNILPSNWGSAIEDHAKLTHFINRLRGGKSVTEAAQSAKKYLFDYSDLTDFEKNIMKRVFPFYTWTRKNLPLQVEMLITKPQKFSRLQQLKSNIEKNVPGDPLDDKYIPDYMKGMAPMFLGGDKQGANYLSMQGYIPSADLGKLTDPLQIATEMLSPLIKTPYELSTNYSAFYQRPILEFPGQNKNILGVEMPAQLEYALRNIRPLSEAEKVLAIGGLKTGNQYKTDPLSALMAFGIGKTKYINRADAKSGYKYRQAMEKGKIKSAMNRAKDQHRMDEYRRLKEMYNAMD